MEFFYCINIFLPFFLFQLQHSLQTRQTLTFIILLHTHTHISTCSQVKSKQSLLKCSGVLLIRASWLGPAVSSPLSLPLINSPLPFSLEGHQPLRKDDKDGDSFRDVYFQSVIFFVLFYRPSFVSSHL